MKPISTDHPSIEETYTEYRRIVFPRDSNPAGFLFGGKMLNWMIDAGTFSSYRLAEREVFLGFLDNVYFINPVKIGSILTYRCWIPRTGRSSIDVYIEALVRDRSTNKVYLSSVSKMIFVAVDEGGRPVSIGRSVTPNSSWEKKLHSYFQRWHSESIKIVDRYKKMKDTGNEVLSKFQIESVKRVTVEDTFLSNVMYAGSLMLSLDEVAAIMASTYAEGNVVTASVDQMIFVEPIKVNEYIKIVARVTRTWNTSMEIAVDVWSISRENKRRKLRSYFTFVHVDESGKPLPVKQFKPHSVEEFDEWEGAENRRSRRLRELKGIQRYRSVDLSIDMDSVQPITLKDLLSETLI